MLIFKSGVKRFFLFIIALNFVLILILGDLTGSNSICQGDSGGPLFYKTVLNGSLKYVQVGISSFTTTPEYGGCESKFPE